MFLGAHIDKVCAWVKRCRGLERRENDRSRLDEPHRMRRVIPPEVAAGRLAEECVAIIRPRPIRSSCSSGRTHSSNSRHHAAQCERFPNWQGEIGRVSNEHIVSIDHIEKVTGINFFRDLPDSKERAVEEASRWRLVADVISSAPSAR